jgi:alanine-synthesizing transaminase
MSTPSLLEAPGFQARLEQARMAGRALLDLTEALPSRCGLGWNPGELRGFSSSERVPRHDAERTLREAREAVSSYLAGRGASVDPDRVFLSSSSDRTYASLLDLLCARDDEVLIPSPSRPFLDALAESRSVRVRRYSLLYDGGWRLDRKSLRKMRTPRTRAIVVGNPSDPTGAMMTGDDLAFLEGFCSRGEVALIGDETFSDTALTPCPGVVEVKECLAFHVSGLSGVCGLPELHAEWLAAAGPDALVRPALSRLEALVASDVPGAAQLAIPALLARRERYLSALRARLSENRSYLATAALREAPWSLQWGAGGWSAVLQIGAAEEEEPLCRALLEDGVVVQPGSFHGLPANGFLVVSLLPEPAIFREGLSRLDRRLRGPLLG